MGQGTKQTFPKKSYSGQQVQKRCSMSLIISEMQIKTIFSHLLEWLLSLRQVITSVGEDMEKREHWCAVGRSVN